MPRKRFQCRLCDFEACSLRKHLRKKHSWPKGVHEEQMEAYINQNYADSKHLEYTNSLLNYVRRQARAGSGGKAALRGNAKTLMSVDISTNCPWRMAGAECLFCYVAQARSTAEVFRHELGMPEGTTYEEMKAEAARRGGKKCPAYRP